MRGLASSCALALLAACATAPPSRPPVPVSPALPGAANRTAALPELPRPELSSPAAPIPPPDLWSRLRASFAMDSCDADPAILARARFDTRHPRAFEQHLRAAAPMIEYVEAAATRYHVAGEFVLLPWVESHFHAGQVKRNRPAGMWQIMPVTARSLGLRMSSDYDARLDRIAATDAVMRLLSRYHARWNDWRLVDLAYNSGEFRIARWVKAHGLPPAQPVIPQASLGHTTRRHLAKLLAIACVIRDPGRFHVSLPVLDPGARLQTVQLLQPMRVDRAARMAGMALKDWRQLNAAYRGTRMPPDAPLRVLLPLTRAQTFAAGYAQRERQLQLPHVQPAPRDVGGSRTAVEQTPAVEAGGSL